MREVPNATKQSSLVDETYGQAWLAHNKSGNATHVREAGRFDEVRTALKSLIAAMGVEEIHRGPRKTLVEMGRARTRTAKAGDVPGRSGVT